MKNYKLFMVSLLLLLLCACTVSNEKLYRRAVADAQKAKPKEVNHNLLFIDPKADSVLVVTWTNYTKYKVDTTTTNREIWVTLCPELLQKITLKDTAQSCLRIKQLLGLPPTANKTLFVEFWVKPSDLFRPCPDKEVTDKECDLCFPPYTDSVYKDWFLNKQTNSFADSILYNKYPWTRLGYTYDWSAGSKNHRGLSEFVIPPQRQIRVAGIYPNQDYLTKQTTIK